MRISVIGGSNVDPHTQKTAEAVGRLLANREHAVVCGGLGGVMRAVCRGARGEGGETIGILPSSDPTKANEYVTTAVATGLGHARNALVPLNGDAVIAIQGGPGTLSEIGFALVYGRPVVGLDTHQVEQVHSVEDPKTAVDYVERITEMNEPGQ